MSLLKPFSTGNFDVDDIMEAVENVLDPKPRVTNYESDKSADGYNYKEDNDHNTGRKTFPYSVPDRGFEAVSPQTQGRGRGIYPGKEVHLLRVVGRIDMVPGEDRRWYECVCLACGKHVLATYHQLYFGYAFSCGCTPKPRKPYTRRKPDLRFD